MEIVKLNKNNWSKVLLQTKKVLLNDGLAVFPSDTVYGLAVNACSQKAVGKLLEFKNRPIGKAISICVSNLNAFAKFAFINKEQQTTLRSLLPGPFTVVLPSKHQTDLRLEAEDKTIGLRYPACRFMNNLNSVLDFPYTATSANLHGKNPCYSVNALLNTLSEKKKRLIDLIVDYGTLPNNLPSTVINLSGDQLKIIRPGKLNPQLISQTISKSENQTQAVAGQLIISVLQERVRQPVVFILQGELGSGKTIFTKGLGNYLGTETVISPTYVIFYEYQTKNKQIKYLYHFDLYRIENKTDLENLQVEQYNRPGNLLVFEWGEKIGSIDNLIKDQNALVFLINFFEKNTNEREIGIYRL